MTRFAAGLMLLLWLTTSTALNSRVELLDYHHDIWTTKQGAPSEVTCMAQTSDGWLWIGSTYGLYLFDGLKFRHFEALEGETAPERPITSLTALPNGDLLVGYFHSGMSLVHQGHISHFPTTVRKQTVGAVSSATIDGSGTVWIAGSAGLLMLRNGAWEEVGTSMGLPHGVASNLTLDQYGQLWIGANHQLFVLDVGATRFRSVLQDVATINLITSPDGRLWVDTHAQLIPVPPQHRGPSKARPAWLAQSEGQENGIFDRDGNYWALACPVGVCRAAGVGAMPAVVMQPNLGQRSKLDQAWQLGSLSGNLLFEDRDGNIWVGTQAGVERFREDRLIQVKFDQGERYFHLLKDGADGPLVLTVSSETIWRLSSDKKPEFLEKLSQERWGTISRGADGALLIGRTDYLERRLQGKPERIDYPADPSGKLGFFPVTRVIDDGANLWVSGARRGTSRYRDGKWSTLEELGLPPSVFFMAAGERGAMWLGYRDGSVIHFAADRATRYEPSAASNVGAISFLHAGNDLVIGGVGGLAVLQKGQFKRLRTSDPYVISSVSGMVSSANGDQWLNGSKGVVHVLAADWREAVDGAGGLLKYQLIGASEGYPGAAAVITRNPTAVADDHGRLWFYGSGGLAWLDSRQAGALPQPPIVKILAVTAGDRRYLDLAAPVSLAPGTSAFHIEYTALSYHAPELVQFKYRLVGVDTGWQDAGGRRDISYTKMTPGDYQLQILAVDGMGQLSANDTTLTVRIPPTFLQSRYFDALCVAAGGILFYLIYRLRLNLAKQRNTILVTERERIARALHDSFLQSVHGLVMVFQTALSSLSSESEARKRIERVLTLADHVIEEGRDEVQELRSSLMTEGNLPRALEVVGTLLKDTCECAFTVRVEGDETKLREIVLREAYNIGRESLINAFRHANAKNVELVLSYTVDSFTLLVSDNGSGIPAETLARGNAQGHWGLQGMRERTEQLDGLWEVSSDASGTRIRMTIPASRAYANLARVQRWWAGSFRLR